MNQAERTKKVVIERTYRASLDDVWELWTTKQGFESWWGPEGFRADVHELDARAGGTLRYDMVADTPEMVAAMAKMGGASHAVHARFVELRARERLVIRNVIDFIPNVAAYESDIEVDFVASGADVTMKVTLHGMHNEEMSGMQQQGFVSQLGKLDKRFGGEHSPPA